MPNDDELYAALLERKPNYEGLAYVCVKSTGVFCRLTCPARKPKRENSIFFETIVECMEAGYRPCLRCKPLDSLSDQDPLVKTLLAALEKEPDRRWRESDIQAMGFDPSTVRRSFKRNYGITFLEMARLRRLKNGAESLATGSSVIDAQINAGFESSSGFRSAFSRLTGQSPSQLKGDEKLKADWIETPIGEMIAVSDDQALYLLEFWDRKALPNELKRLRKNFNCSIAIGNQPATEQIRKELQAYFSGENFTFTTPIGSKATPFTEIVWNALRNIPIGETRSYGELARAVGKPSASRAVARANGANQIAIVIPCHRVIGADGSLTGYGGGLWRKQWLLEHEKKFL